METRICHYFPWHEHYSLWLPLESCRGVNPVSALVFWEKKESGSFNHMEKNVYKVLQDTPTITELCVLTLYAQLVSHPYMMAVWQPDGTDKNALNLGPLHDKVKLHCKKITDNPNLLLAPNTSHIDGALDREMWHHPHIFYAVHKLTPTLPHLSGATSAFFSGTGSTWDHFSSEHDIHSTIATLSPEECQQALMNATNNHNEGALSTYRVDARKAPRMTLAQWNAWTMYI